MKTLYSFTTLAFGELRTYQSTNLELLQMFCWKFSFVVDIEVAGESEQEIELQKV